MPTMHGPILDAPFERDQISNIEICGCRLGYNTSLVRSAVVGTVLKEVDRLEKVVIEGLEASLEVSRSGNTCTDHTRSFIKPIEKAGFIARPMVGYSAGVGMIGQGTIDSDMTLSLDDDTPFEPNMTFHVPPCFKRESVDGWSMMVSDSFMITEDGPAELLCHLPRKLYRF